MFAKFKWIWAAILILAGACQPQYANLPDKTPEIWRMQMPDSLSWLGPKLNVCTQQQSDVALIIEARPQSEPVSDTADMILRWGDPPAEDQNTWFQIGEDNLVIITHPDNPLSEITADQLQRIFTGQIRSWSEIGEYTEGIFAVDLPAGNEIHQAFSASLGEKPSLSPGAQIAADAVTMRQAVAAQPGAIGYLPARWLDDSVKKLPVIDSRQPRRITFPVLIRFVKPPNPAQQTWLDCLQ